MLKLLKHINKMGFYRTKRQNGFVFPLFRKYPDYIKGSWCQWTLCDDQYGHRALETLYLNNNQPSGTLIFSNFINNDYPTAWANIILTGHNKKDNYHTAVIDRLYCDPVHRRKKIGLSLAILGYTVFWGRYRIRVQQGKSATSTAYEMQTQAAESIMLFKGKTRSSKKAMTEVIGSSSEMKLDDDMGYTQDPMIPAVWHSIRTWE